MNKPIDVKNDETLTKLRYNLALRCQDKAIYKTPFKKRLKRKNTHTVKGVGVSNLWAHLDLNQGPTDYESVALTI